MNYRKLWEQHFGPIPVDKRGRSYEIHHIDGNRKNNSLENLKCLSIEEHLEIHRQQGDEIACHAISLRMKKESLKGWHHSEEMKRKFSKSRKGRKHSTESIEKMKTARLGKKHSSKTKEKLSEASKKPLIHVGTGYVYDSIKAAAKILGFTAGAILYRLKKGEFKYITKFEYETKKQSAGFLQLKKHRGGDTQKKRVQHVSTGKVYESVTAAGAALNIAVGNMNYYIRKRVFIYV